MAVVEYMNHVYLGDHRRHIPGFIKAPGNWYKESDKTFVGWTPTNPDFYVPDTLLVLTKEDIVQRALAIHADTPIMVQSADSPEMVALADDAAVRAYAEQWYDDFVASNLLEEQSAG